MVDHNARVALRVLGVMEPELVSLLYLHFFDTDICWQYPNALCDGLICEPLACGLRFILESLLADNCIHENAQNETKLTMMLSATRAPCFTGQNVCGRKTHQRAATQVR